VRSEVLRTNGDFTEEIPLAFTTQTLISSNPQEQLVQTIHHHIQHGTFTCKLLENWTTTALYGTLQLICNQLAHNHNPTTQWKREIAIARLVITRQIRQRMMKLQVHARKQIKSIIITQYFGEESERLQLQNVLNDDNIAPTFPIAAKLAIGTPKLRWSYEKPIGSKLIGDKETLRDFNFDDNSTDPKCLCDEPRWTPFKCPDGHVCTTNLNCIQDEEYREMCKRGVSFKLPPTGSNCVDSVRAAITRYICITSEKLGIHPIEFEEWKCKLMEQVQTRYSHQQPEHHKGRKMNWDKCKRTHKKFNKNWVLIQSDKSSNTFSWKCKACLLQQARVEMSQASTYQRCNSTTQSQVMKKHKAFTVKNAKVNTEASFQAVHPSLGALIKNHKQQANRWLARSRNTSLSTLSRWIHKALKACMQTTERIWIDLMYYWYIHSEGSWIIDKHERVRQCMNKMNSYGITPPPSGMSSYDFSAMYT
jgi:hypothetical protein